MTEPATCDNRYIQVSIPGSILSAKNYGGICFRVGGEICCYPLSPNAFSNTVCKNLLPQVDVSPPEPPCINTNDISNFPISVSYSPEFCEGVHRCNRAIFLLYINDTQIGQVNLNNAENGAPKSVDLTIPAGIVSNQNQYKIALIKSPTLDTVHKGLARIQIKNLSNDVIFDYCLANDQEIFVNTCI